MIEITTRRQYTTAIGGKCRRFRVDEDGAVSAWDDIAGHYTTLHGLTSRQERMIRAEVLAMAISVQEEYSPWP